MYKLSDLITLTESKNFNLQTLCTILYSEAYSSIDEIMYIYSNETQDYIGLFDLYILPDCLVLHAVDFNKLCILFMYHNEFLVEYCKGKSMFSAVTYVKMRSSFNGVYTEIPGTV